MFIWWEEFWLLWDIRRSFLIFSYQPFKSKNLLILFAAKLFDANRYMEYIQRWVSNCLEDLDLKSLAWGENSGNKVTFSTPKTIVSTSPELNSDLSSRSLDKQVASESLRVPTKKKWCQALWEPAPHPLLGVQLPDQKGVNPGGIYTCVNIRNLHWRSMLTAPKCDRTSWILRRPYGAAREGQSCMCF